MAGKCLETKKWIRPVGSPLGAELTAIQSSARNPYGIYPVKTLQKVNISFKGEVPLEHQPENRLVDGSEWQQRYNVSKDELSQFLDSPDSLWGQGSRVNYGDIQRKWVQVEQSLYLVQVDNLMLYTAESGSKRKAAFSYNGFDYDLPVTSPNFDDLVYKQDGLMGILCISLGENYQGNCYKIIAAIY